MFKNPPLLCERFLNQNPIRGKTMKTSVYMVYKKLFDAFGPQGWWPITADGETKPVHSGKEPNNERERFEIIVGAILTQNTSWRNVEKAIENLNRERMVDVRRVANSDENYFAELIKPAGYYNQKAKRLKGFAEFLLKKYDGDTAKLFSLDLKDLRSELLNLKGIGPETADSIILYAAEKPVFVVDAYTTRIFSRLGFTAKDYDELQKLFMENLPRDVALFKEYHALLVNLGKNYCKKNKPDCNRCPLSDICRFQKHS